MHQVLTMSQPMPSTLQPLGMRPGAIATRAPVTIGPTPVNVALRPGAAASPHNVTSLPNTAGMSVAVDPNVSYSEIANTLVKRKVVTGLWIHDAVFPWVHWERAKQSCRKLPSLKFKSLFVSFSIFLQFCIWLLPF